MTRQEKKEELIGLFLHGAITIGDLIDECFEFWQKHPHWISVEDELPQKDDTLPDFSIDVLATDGNEIYKSFYDSSIKNWFDCDIWPIDNITHWMPLPSVEHLNKK